MNGERWHDPSGRGCAIAGMVARGDTPMTGDACKACLEDIANEADDLAVARYIHSRDEATARALAWFAQTYGTAQVQ